MGLEDTSLKRMRLILRRGGERVLSLGHSSSTSSTGTDAEPLLPLHVLTQSLLHDNPTADIVSRAMADCPKDRRRTSRRRNEVELRSHSDPSEI